MEFFIKEDEIKIDDDWYTIAKYMIREEAPGGGYIESYFENGEEFRNYLDKHKILSDQLFTDRYYNDFVLNLLKIRYRLGV